MASAEIGSGGNMIIVEAGNCSNLAYCSLRDFPKFRVPGSNHHLALVNHTWVLSVSGSAKIPDDCIGLNWYHRHNARLALEDHVFVSRFDDPINDMSSLALELELDEVEHRSDIIEIDRTLLAQHIHTGYIGQVMSVGQLVYFAYGPNFLKFVVKKVVGREGNSVAIERGMISSQTDIEFEASNTSGIKIIDSSPSTTISPINNFWHKMKKRKGNFTKDREIDLESHGIGGLKAVFDDIFRSVYISRLCASETTKMGIKHVKGILLYGPPGTGKTLMARELSKMFNTKDPKIVSGPQILSKYVGSSEKSIRELFADAENDQKHRGEQSELHVIIFDEIDAICKPRGSGNSSAVNDGVVNQLLAKMDGVEPLNNILLIGMTSRKDLLDEALLRPGRFEVQVEVSLPDEVGRLQILKIHTWALSHYSRLSPGVDLRYIASMTKNYSGAELEGVVRSAFSHALNRQLNPKNLSEPLNGESIEVTKDDFQKALNEVKPSFGASFYSLNHIRVHGILDCGERHKHIYERCMLLVEQVKGSTKSPLVTCLLEGPSGSGKSAMASTVGIDSKYGFVKIISAETLLGFDEVSKSEQIVKVFEDAYKSDVSMIILDEIERLIEYVPIGSCVSNLLSQTVLVLIKRRPPQGKRLLVIGTTSDLQILKSLGIYKAFIVTHNVPALEIKDVRKVLEQLNVFAEEDLDTAANALNKIPLKNIFTLIDMAAQQGRAAEDVYSGEEKISMSHFFDCLHDLNQNEAFLPP